jgi:TonB family protein
VLRHERAHVRRGDLLVGALIQLACIAAWPVLPAWIAARRLRALMEVACDEEAVRGADGSARRRYGEVLLALAESALPRPLGPVLSFGSPLKGRLRALGARRRWPTAVQALVVAGAGALAFACAGEPQEGAGRVSADGTGDLVPPRPAAASTPARPTRRLSDPVLTITRGGDFYLGNKLVPRDALEEEVRRELSLRGGDTVLLRGDRDSFQVDDIMSKVKRAGARNVAILREPAREASSPVPATVTGQLDKKLIARTIREHISEMKACYEGGLAARPELAGRVNVQFTIDTDGAVVTSVLAQSTLGEPRVENCLVKAVRSWKFPPPDGGIVIVNYPFEFTPSSQPGP